MEKLLQYFMSTVWDMDDMDLHRRLPQVRRNAGSDAVVLGAATANESGQSAP
jgi:hypothetical protein